MLQATAKLAMESDKSQVGHDRMQTLMRPDAGHSQLNDAAHKQAYRTLSLRWHPDKFQAKYGTLIPEDDIGATMQRVCSIFQCVSNQWQSYMEAGTL